MRAVCAMSCAAHACFSAEERFLSWAPEKRQPSTTSAFQLASVRMLHVGGGMVILKSRSCALGIAPEVSQES